MSSTGVPPGPVSSTSAPCPNAGRRRGSVKLAPASTGHSACQAKPPSTTIDRKLPATIRSSASSHGAQVSRSPGVGLFSGGAHLTAATIRAPISRCPSPARTLAGCAASPHRYSDANRKSPLRSPVKIRPVLLPPCAAGASPTMRTDGAGSPQPAIGRPQYCSAAKDLRRSAATSSRQATRRGHARHTDCRAVSSGSDAAPDASSRTCSALSATGVAAVAGSPGQPVPGATGPATMRCRRECRAR